MKAARLTGSMVSAARHAGEEHLGALRGVKLRHRRVTETQKFLFLRLSDSVVNGLCVKSVDNDREG
jgi:hypothetical protein